MEHVRLVHWHETEAWERAERVRALGYSVEWDPPDQHFLRALQERRPDVLVIDLGRLPAQGRDLALAIRNRKRLCTIPLVFVGGAAAKVEMVREMLPDATFTRWESLKSALERALVSPTNAPPLSGGVFAGYSGTPLYRKLGIKEGAVVVLVGAPRGFEERLDDIPAGVTFRRRARGACDLVIWFVKARRQLENRVVAMGAVGPALWIAWPKKASGVVTDLNQNVVRRVGLDSGLVDYKICAIDPTWSGLKFTRREQG